MTLLFAIEEKNFVLRDENNIFWSHGNILYKNLSKKYLSFIHSYGQLPTSQIERRCAFPLINVS